MFPLGIEPYLIGGLIVGAGVSLILISLSLGTLPVEYIIAVDGTPTGVMKAAVADSATATTKIVGSYPKESEVLRVIGIKIAAVALFDMKFVITNETVQSRRRMITAGMASCNEIMKLQILHVK